MRRRIGTLLAAVLAVSAATVPSSPEPAEAATSCNLGGETSYLYCNPTPRGIYIMKHSNGTYYSYQKGGQGTFPVHTSRDLVNWTFVPSDVKPKGATWWDADPDIWPVEVIQHNGKFYMFYSAVASEAKRARTSSCINNHFVGLAIADSPTGPFYDIDRPLMGGAPYSENGVKWGQIRTIDPNPFIDDDGTVYLYFAKPGGCYLYNGVRESRTYVARLRADLKQIDSQPKLLLQPCQNWDNPDMCQQWEYRSGTNHVWNEAPQILKQGGKYYLMYSANKTAEEHYAIGYAVSDSPLGPFTKYHENPLLASIDGVLKAGHNHVVLSPDGRDVYTTYQTFSGRFLSRIGVRGNGTLYANGSYASVFQDGDELRVAPKPSGAPIYDSAGNQVAVVFDQTRRAVTTASSTASGGHYKPQALKDGEIGIRPRHSDYDWKANGQRVGAWVNLNWINAHPVDTILIYPSATEDNRVASGTLALSDGKTISVTFPSDPKAPAVIGAAQLGGRVYINNLKFTVTGMRSTAAGAAALSEISVLGPAD